ncbi:MAG: hypothetical protein JNM56_30760 [Planctomycetia bacterium]|nr:hypothetical protein [Planctomycetia bacterium]
MNVLERHVCALGLPLTLFLGVCCNYAPDLPSDAPAPAEAWGPWTAQGEGDSKLARVWGVLGASRLPCEPLDYINRVEVQFAADQGFRVRCPRLWDARNPVAAKELTRAFTNTCVRCEDRDYPFGKESPNGRWLKDRGRLWKELPLPDGDPDRTWLSVRDLAAGQVRVSQSVEIVLGQHSRLYDTILVRYRVINLDWRRRQVGLRVLLHPRIGSPVDVPFHLPPHRRQSGQAVRAPASLARPDIPDFLTAIESADFKNLDLAVAFLGLRVDGSEPLERLIVCDPPPADAGWEWDFAGKRPAGPPAECGSVVLYWNSRSMKPGEQRDLAFTFGLDRIKSDFGGKADCPSKGRLRVVCGRARVGETFPILAFIKAADPEQTAALSLPDGLTLVGEQQAEQRVTPAGKHGYSQVSWTVRASRVGEFRVTVDVPNVGHAAEGVRLLAALR